MTTWAPLSEPSTTWTQENTPTRVFSPLVFSHASYGGKYIFSMNPRAGVWDNKTEPSTTWTAE